MQDNQRMSVARLDAKRKLEVPGGEPGQLFRIEEQGSGRFVIERVAEPERKKKTAEQIIAAIKANPICPNMTWEELRAMTREP
jgi:hypothetical protein